MSAPVTSRQLETLAFVLLYAQQYGIPPTLEEIGVGIGNRSKNSTSDILRALKRKELVDWRPRRSRTLILTEAGRQCLANAVGGTP